ncbi:hypothetical protein Tco_0508707 [Tanacetum coccineum]
MSDSEDSTVTYMAVSSPFRGLSDIGSPGVDGPPVMPEDPYTYMVAAFQAIPSPDYVSGPDYPPLPEFVPKPVYPDFMPPEDDEDLEEDDDEDSEEDPANYPTDRDDDDEEEEPSGDKADDEEEDEDDEEEEEHPAPADSVPPPIHLVIARISIRAQTPVSLPSDTEAARLLAIPTPPPLPLSPWSSPLPQIPLPPLLLRAEAPSTSHSLLLPPPIILSRTRSDAPPSGTPPILPIPLPTSSPSLLLPSTNHGADMPEDEMLEDMSGAPTTDEIELGRRMTTFVTTIRQDTDEIYVRLSGVLGSERARTFCEAWGRSMDASDLASSGRCMALHYSVVALQQVKDCQPCEQQDLVLCAGTAYGDTETDEYTADTGDSTAGTVGTC